MSPGARHRRGAGRPGWKFLARQHNSPTAPKLQKWPQSQNFVQPSNACFVTKRNKDYYITDVYPNYVVHHRVNQYPCVDTWNTLKFGSNWPRWSENANFQSTVARSASAVTPSERSSIITTRKSTTRFSMSLRWISCVSPKSTNGEGSKTQNDRFPSKIALRLKKHCYKVSLCKNRQRQSCKAFIGLCIHEKWLVA